MDEMEAILNSKKTKLKKIIILIILTLAMALGINTAVYATDSYYNVVDEIYGTTQTASAGVDWDPRGTILNIKIKDQGSEGLCWAFASTSMFELNLQKQNNITYTQSIRHMAMFAFFEHGNQYGGGANDKQPVDYYVKGMGPISESNFPDNSTFENYKKSGVKPDYIANNVNILTWMTQDEIKQYIKENGPIVTAMYTFGGKLPYVNPKTGAYYVHKNVTIVEDKKIVTVPEGRADHAVVIVGWDDNYSRTNFLANCMPTKDGAWLILQSWGNKLGNGLGGTTWGQNNSKDIGYMWVSYEDITLGKAGLYGISNIKETNYNKSYDNYIKYDNVFTTEVNIWSVGAILDRNKDLQEELTQVGFMVDGTGILYKFKDVFSKCVDCDIYVNTEDGDVTKQKLVKSVKDVKAGYHVIELDTPLKLTGDKFTISVLYKSKDGKPIMFSGGTPSSDGISIQGETPETSAPISNEAYIVRAYTKLKGGTEEASKRFASIAKMQFSKISNNSDYIGKYDLEVKTEGVNNIDVEWRILNANGDSLREYVYLKDQPKLDANGNPILDKNGNVEMETVEVLDKNGHRIYVFCDETDFIETKDGFKLEISIKQALKNGTYWIVLSDAEGPLAIQKFNHTYNGVNTATNTSQTPQVQKSSAFSINPQIMETNENWQEAKAYRNTELSKEEYLKQEDLFYYSTKGEIIYEKAPEGEDTSKDARVEVGTLIDEQVNQLRTSNKKLENKTITEKTKEDPMAKNPYGNNDSVVATSNTIAKYSQSGKVQLTPQEIYILSHAKDLEWDVCKTQQALLIAKGERIDKGKQESAQVVDNLVKESEKYAEYIEKLNNFKSANNNKIIADRTDYSNIKVGYDGTTNQILTGPYSVDYVYESFEVNPSGESEVVAEGSKKITYGEIVSLKIYADSRKSTEIRNWEFVFPNRSKEEEYNWPKPGEEFWIKFSNTLNKDVTTVGKFVFSLDTMQGSGEALLLKGTYSEIEWVAKDKEIRCTKCGTNLICEHGEKQTHKIDDYTYCRPQYCGIYYEKTGELRRARDGHLQGHEFYVEARTKESSKQAIELIQVKRSEIWKGIETVELAFGETIELIMEIKGNVWVENANANEEGADGTKSGEAGLGKVEVSLYNQEGLQETVTTDGSGNYEFTDLRIGNTYYINFVYDGMTYRATNYLNSNIHEQEEMAENTEQYTESYEANPDAYQNSSHAVENKSDRTDFNGKFSTVIKNLAIGSQGTTKLTYKTSSAGAGSKSELVTTNASGAVKEEFKTNASTSAAGLVYPVHTSYVIGNADLTLNENGNKIYKKTYEYMNNVNLGLVKREQGSLTITEDVTEVAYTIQQKVAKFSGDVNQKAAANAEERPSDYFDKQYTTEINRDDWNWRHTFVTSDLVTTEDEMQGYVTCKIVVNNNSSNISGSVGELVTHYDSNLTYSNLPYDTRIGLVNSWAVVNGVTMPVLWGTASRYNASDRFALNADFLPWFHEVSFLADGLSLFSGYKTMYTSSLDDITLLPGEKIELYVVYKINKNNERALQIKDNGGGARKNTTEINGYSMEDGRINQGSNPGNAKMGNTRTYEADTDKSPDLNIQIHRDNEGRTLTGYVWEDNREKVLSNRKVVGDGIREEEETHIENVKVDLVPMVYNPETKQYEETEFTKEYKNKITDRTSKGYYKFTNLAGGVYKIRYTYGDEAQLKQNVDMYYSTKYNGHDYQSTTYLGEGNTNRIARASDNEVTGKPNAKVKGRDAVLEYSSVMTYKQAEVLDVNHINSLYRESGEWLAKVTELAKNTTMTADSVNCDFGIQSLKYEVPEINLGLVERPRQKIEIKDEVDNVQIVLSDGTELINTKKGNSKNVQNINNEKIYAYMDKEIMQGATVNITYKITVSNVSEIDTLSSYYKNGSAGTIPTSIGTIYSYYDNQIFRATDNNRVEIVNGNGKLRSETGMWSAVTDLQLQETTRSSLSTTGYKAVATNSLSGISLYPKTSNEVRSGREISEVSIYLTLSKVISGQDDATSLEYDNYVEIVKKLSASGRRDYNGIIGNYVAGTEITERDTAISANVTIMPPFGGRYFTYYALAIASAAILGAGIIFIRKKIL